MSQSESFSASIIPSCAFIALLRRQFLADVGLFLLVKPRKRELQHRLLFQERVRTIERTILSKPIGLSIHESLKGISIDLSKDRAGRVTRVELNAVISQNSLQSTGIGLFLIADHSHTQRPFLRPAPLLASCFAFKSISIRVKCCLLISHSRETR